MPLFVIYLICCAKQSDNKKVKEPENVLETAVVLNSKDKVKEGDFDSIPQN